MYVVQNKKLAVYRYIRFCPESWIGEFIKQTTLDHLGITDALPFHSNGREYLAVAGKIGGVLRIDPSEKFVQELQIGNQYYFYLVTDLLNFKSCLLKLLFF